MPGRAAQFASALIGNLMIGMLSLMAMEWWDPDRPTARLWAIPAATIAAELAFALFARWRWNWRAFLAGTLCAAGFLLVIAGCLIGFLVFIYT